MTVTDKFTLAWESVLW